MQPVAAQDVLFGLGGGQHDHGNDEQLWVPLQLGEHLKAGHAREVDVEQDQSRARRVGERAGPAHELERLLAVGYHVQGVA